MIKFAGSLLAVLAVAGCAAGSGTNPFSTESEAEIIDKAEESTIPEELANNLEAASYSEAGGTPTLQVYTTLDGAALIDTYTRTPSLDVGPYIAFTKQQTNLQRHFTGFAKISDDPDGTVRAMVAGDGGQFGTFYAGGAYERTGDYVRPDSGLVSYTGRYVAVTNLSGNSVVFGGAVPDDLRADQSARLEGTILINADFNQGIVNGGITDRIFTDYPTYVGIPRLDLDAAPIDENGEFFGTTSVDQQEKGNWGGIFGGDGATAVAGVVQASNWGGDTTLENEEEHGIFVLSRCGVTGEGALCAEE
ncbi:hypothetical protein DI396_01840 [Litorivita pollutaquae]|uniref:Thymidylate synthase n=1 Tax=Litorivita pollutaquae TaxID=2200892 RepID=A0A2V4NV00_9RHOB|nr:hypothetical protein [Litorivita pollutaquae]PYC48856.1 hypothetical protein DI396_01840 [Litorivita pollutaquae]